MKNVRRIATMLMALAVLFAMAIPVLADTTGTITIENTVSGETYKAYQVLTLESYDTTAATYSYKPASDAWKTFFTSGAGATYVSVDSNGYATWIADTNATTYQAFAAAVIAYAEAQSIEPVSATATGTETKFTDLPLGYYVVDSTLGSVCVLTTNDPDTTVIEKNAASTLVKEVKEGDTYGESNTVAVGDTVYYRLTITIVGKAKELTVIDNMPDNITLNSDTITIKKGTATVADTNYTVTPSGNDFEIAFVEEFCNDLASGDVLTVEYTGTVTNTIAPDVGEINEAKLTYKDAEDNKTETTPDTTETKTFDIDVFKYYVKDSSENPLAGAKFALYSDSACANQIPLAVDSTNVYEYAAAGTAEIVTDSTGKFKIQGLDAGTYYLKETDAPDGYNELNTVVTIVIAEDGTYSADGTAVTDQIKVENKAGTLLPETGGIGTTIFYTLGGLIVVAAVVLLITKKRMTQEA